MDATSLWSKAQLKQSQMLSSLACDLRRNGAAIYIVAGTMISLVRILDLNVTMSALIYSFVGALLEPQPNRRVVHSSRLLFDAFWQCRFYRGCHRRRGIAPERDLRSHLRLSCPKPRRRPSEDTVLSEGRASVLPQVEEVSMRGGDGASRAVSCCVSGEDSGVETLCSYWAETEYEFKF
jgi:hypothetical protein